MKSFSCVLIIVFINLERTTDNFLFKFVSISSLVIFIFYSYVSHRKIAYYRLPYYMILLVLLILVGVLRSGDPYSSIGSELNKFSVYVFSLFGCYLSLSISLSKGYSPQKIFVWLIFIPLLGLVFINIIGFSLGFSSLATEGTDLGDSVFMSYFGFNLKRVSFPFSTGFNTYSSIVGILFLFSLFGLRYFRKYKALMWLGLLCSVFTLLLIDSRSALLYPIFIFILFALIFGMNRIPKFLWLIPLMVFYGPFLLTWILSILNEISLFSFLSRSSEDFMTANSRTIIWFMASLEFIEFKLVHLIGFGDYGHFSSGASALWSGIFGQWGDSSLLITPHSTFYSILYDYGYFGLVLVIFVQLKVLNIIKENFKNAFKVLITLLAFFLYWNLVGVVETFFGFYTPNSLLIFSIVIMFVFFLRKKSIFDNRKQISRSGRLKFRMPQS